MTTGTVILQRLAWRCGHRHARLLRPLQSALLQTQRIHLGVNVSDVFFLNAFDGFPALLDFRHQGLETAWKSRRRRRDGALAIDLQRDRKANGIAVFKPLCTVL